MEKVCLNCQTEFLASGKRKFCSDKCKVAFSRAKKSLISTPADEGKVTRGNLEWNKIGGVDFKPDENGKYGYLTPANQFFDKYGSPTEKPAEEANVTVKLTKNDFFIKSTNEFEWEKQQSEMPYFDVEKIRGRLDALAWVKEIEEYCQNAGITPQVLIECHRHQNKPQIAKKQGNESKIKESPMSDFRKNLVHHKTGYKGK